MSVTLSPPKTDEREPHFVLSGIGWSQYVSISEALPDQPGLKLVYNDGRLTFLSPSRRHDWYSETIGHIVAAVAREFEIEIEVAGQATFRSQEPKVGVEGDKTFYFGPHAELMRGPLNVDLSTQPPPDLVIEIEVTHSADDAVAAWDRLGTPEVWRYNTDSETLRFLVRGEDSRYADNPRSAAFPFVEPGDLMGQIRLAEELGFSRWFAQLPEWVRTVLLPRRGG